MLANFTLQVEKLDSLEQAREEKLTRLQGSGLNQGASLGESYSILNGNMDSNRNKIHKKVLFYVFKCLIYRILSVN